MKYHKLKTLIKIDKLLRKNGGHMLRSQLKASLKKCTDDTLSDLIYNHYLDYYRDGTDGEIYMTDKSESAINENNKFYKTFIISIFSLLISIISSITE